MINPGVSWDGLVRKNAPSSQSLSNERKLSTHKNTLVIIYILYLRDLITESNELLINSHENKKPIIEALGSSNFEDIKVW